MELEYVNTNPAKHLPAWHALVAATLPQELKEVRKQHLEEALPFLQQANLEPDLESFASNVTAMLELERAILDKEKVRESLQTTTFIQYFNVNISFQPLMSPECEAFCLRTSLFSYFDEKSFSAKEFIPLWRGMQAVLSTAIHRRPDSVALGRIPVVLQVSRKLLGHLVTFSDQSRNVDRQELKELVLCAHQLDR